MIGAFNPYMAGSSPQQPNISLDTVSQLLGGANQGVQALVGGIQKAGEIDRSSKVNELLASGGLQGLTEEQQRRKLAQMTGGQSLNQLVQANATDVMANQKAREIAQADAAAKLGLEEFKFGNDLTKLEKESGYKTELEKLKSEMGLKSDLTLEEAKAKNDLVATNALFGNQSKLEEIKHNLNINSAKKGELPDQWGVLGNGVLYNKTTGDTMLPEEYKKLQSKEEDSFQTLSSEAKSYAKNLTKNQQENLAEALNSGKIGFKPYKEDKKSGYKEGGYFYDAETGQRITISSKRKEQ